MAQAEKSTAGRALRGALSKDPSKNVAVDETKLNERAMRAARRAASRVPTERLSPGVYRSAGGQLVTQQGRPIQRQQTPGIAAQAAGAAAGRQAGGPSAAQAAGQAAGNVQGQVNQLAGQAFGNQAGQYNDFANNLSQLAQDSAGMAGQLGQQAGYYGGQFGGNTPPLQRNMPINDLMYRQLPGQAATAMYQIPQMPQASANQGGRYRLSPGVYGTQQQAMQQYNQQMANMGIQPAYANYEDSGTMLNYFGPGGMMTQRRG